MGAPRISSLSVRGTALRAMVFLCCGARDTHRAQNPPGGKSEARKILGQRCGWTWPPPEEFPSARWGNSRGPGGGIPPGPEQNFAGNSWCRPAILNAKSGTNFRGSALSISRFLHFQNLVFLTFNIRFLHFSISVFCIFQYPVFAFFNIWFLHFAISGFCILQYSVFAFCNIRFLHFAISGFAHFQYPLLLIFNIRFCSIRVPGFGLFGGTAMRGTPTGPRGRVRLGLIHVVRHFPHCCFSGIFLRFSLDKNLTAMAMACTGHCHYR